jgi:hypothetical protein
MADVSLNGSISNIQRGTFKALDTSSAAAKEAASATQSRAQSMSGSDNLGKNIDVMA